MNNSLFDNQKEIIINHFNSINSDSWDKWASYYVPSIRSSYYTFATDKNNQDNNTGILTVDNVEILNIVKIDDTLAPKYPELSTYYSNNKYDCFKVSMKISVNEETKYFHNGFHERIVVLVEDGGKWYVGGSSGCSQKTRGIGTGFLNGDINNPPTTITVGQHDGSTWSKPSLSGTPVDVNFNTFIKTVVYGEIGTMGYLPDAIKAVTVSDRMFSWFCVLGSYRDTYGCDIVGGFDVAYYPKNVGKGSTSFKNTVDSALNNYVLSSKGQFFAVGANNFSKYDYAGSGNVVQSGAQNLAKKGYTWQEILHYYLDNSSYNWPNAGTVIVG